VDPKRYFLIEKSAEWFREAECAVWFRRAGRVEGDITVRGMGKNSFPWCGSVSAIREGVRPKPLCGQRSTLPAMCVYAGVPWIVFYKRYGIAGSDPLDPGP
jgi:hypothetical protein